MTVYYVRPDGSDSNSGTGPSASQAWQTLGKAFQTVVSGDTVYVAPGVYGNANLSFANTFTSTVTIEGDLYGQHFTDLGGGWPVVTAYGGLSGGPPQDFTKPVISLENRSNVTLRRLCVLGTWEPASIFLGYGNVGSNLLIEECLLYKQATNSYAIEGGIIGPTSGLTLRRVTILTLSGNPIRVWWDSTVGNYTVNLTLESCLIWTQAWAAAFHLAKSGSGSGVAGGGLINGCTLIGSSDAVVHLEGTGYSTTNPFRVINSILESSANTIRSDTDGGLIEDYNAIIRLTISPARVNVPAGANSVVLPNTDYPYVLTFPSVGLGFWPPIMPWPGTQLHSLSLSADAPATDLFGRPRNARGAISVANTGQRSSAADADGGTGAALELTGKSCHDLLVPVDPVSTTISVKVKWDSGHGDTNPPQAQLLAAPELGYSGQTLTATAPGTNYQTLTFTSFTPTRKGAVVLRLISRAASSTGKAWFDTVSVT